MDLRLQLVAIAVSGGGFLFTFELVRRRRLQELYALLWLASAALLLGLSVWSEPLDAVSRALGVQYGPSVLFAVALAFGFVLMMHFSLAISRLSDQNKVLAQQAAILQQRLDRLEARQGDAHASEPLSLVESRGRGTA